jgi:hypothetical protein
MVRLPWPVLTVGHPRSLPVAAAERTAAAIKSLGRVLGCCKSEVLGHRGFVIIDKVMLTASPF